MKNGTYDAHKITGTRHTITFYNGAIKVDDSRCIDEDTLNNCYTLGRQIHPANNKKYDVFWFLNGQKLSTAHNNISYAIAQHKMVAMRKEPQYKQGKLICLPC